MNNIHGSGNVFIGSGSGYNEKGSHKLYINDGHGDSTEVMIWGDFQARRIRLNSLVGIGMTPDYFNLSLYDESNPDKMLLKGMGDEYNYAFIALE